MLKMQLTAQPRKESRKKASRKLRREGLIPAIVYGYQKEPTLVSLDAHSFEKQIHDIKDNTLIDLKCGNTSFQVIFKDFQYDILTGHIHHVDFYIVTEGHPLKTRIPINFIGTPEGVKLGGILDTQIEDIKVKCELKDLPEKIDLDISHLGLGEAFYLRDLTFPEGVTLLDPKSQVITRITVPRGARS